MPTSSPPSSSSDPFEGLPEVVEDPICELVPVSPEPLDRPNKMALKIRELEDTIHAESLEIVQDVQSFRDVEPDAVAPPPEWVAQLGKERAWKKFRGAKTGWMSAKDAPVAIKVALGMAGAVIKARATEKSGPKTLNIQVVKLYEEPQAVYPRREVEK